MFQIPHNLSKNVSILTKSIIMKLKSCLLISLFSFLSILSLQAQSYNTALGVRLDTDWGVSLQQRIANKTTIEGLLQNSFKDDRFLATKALECLCRWRRS